jgi:hypothetical protein
MMELVAQEAVWDESHVGCSPSALTKDGRRAKAIQTNAGWDPLFSNSSHDGRLLFSAGREWLSKSYRELGLVCRLHQGQ